MAKYVELQASIIIPYQRDFPFQRKLRTPWLMLTWKTPSATLRVWKKREGRDQNVPRPRFLSRLIADGMISHLRSRFHYRDGIHGNLLSQQMKRYMYIVC
jgi:hypothetical protein